MHQLTEGLRGPRRLALLAAFVALSAVVSAAPFALAGPSASMPEPEAMEPQTATSSDTTAEYVVGATTIRLRGRHDLYRIDGRSGSIVNRRRVDLGVATVYLSRDEVEVFKGRQYARLVSGPYAGWWVAASETAPQSAEQLPAGAHVRLNSGTHVGVRFYAGGSVRMRRSVTLDSEQTFDAERLATFSSRRFVLVTSGPLAGRWVATASGTTVVSFQGSAPSPNPTAAPTAAPTTAPTPAPTTAPSSPAPTPAPTDAVANWNSLVLVYPETDVTFTRADGSDYHLEARMSDTMHDVALDTVDRFRRSVRTWSGGLAETNITVVDVPHALSSLDHLWGGYWVGPEAVQADMDRYAPHGSYDSIFVVWQAKDNAGETVPVGAWGLSLPPGDWANGAGFSSIITPSEMWWWTSSTAPEEVFIHEWMHQVVYFNEDRGRISVDLHAGADYGYDAVDGTWQRWLSDVMQGKVRDGDRYLGISPELWAAGTPSKP